MPTLMVHRPSPESETRPENFARLGSSINADAVKSSNHEAMDAAASPYLGNIGGG